MPARKVADGQLPLGGIRAREGPSSQFGDHVGEMEGHRHRPDSARDAVCSVERGGRAKLVYGFQCPSSPRERQKVSPFR